MKELHTPAEWCQRLGVRVIDPHGWRGIGGVSWNNPISKGEFVGRAAISTTSIVLPRGYPHSVTWTIEGESVTAELHCSAAVGSVCRIVCLSDHYCTSWDFGGEHDLQDCGHCNAIDYVGNCGCTIEFYDGPRHSVVDGPVVIEWDASSEMYVWRYVD